MTQGVYFYSVYIDDDDCLFILELTSSCELSMQAVKTWTI